jgi:hypothetical protein
MGIACCCKHAPGSASTPWLLLVGRLLLLVLLLLVMWMPVLGLGPGQAHCCCGCSGVVMYRMLAW